jgi:hypothetical protein
MVRKENRADVQSFDSIGVCFKELYSDGNLACFLDCIQHLFVLSRLVDIAWFELSNNELCSFWLWKSPYRIHLHQQLTFYFLQLANFMSFSLL